MLIFKILSGSRSRVCKERVLSWKAPPLGYVKLNFDGSLIKESGEACLGVILRDSQLSVLMVASKKERGAFDVDGIETLTTFRELQLTWNLGITHLILHGDSMLTLETICS